MLQPTQMGDEGHCASQFGRKRVRKDYQEKKREKRLSIR